MTDKEIASVATRSPRIATASTSITSSLKSGATTSFCRTWSTRWESLGQTSLKPVHLPPTRIKMPSSQHGVILQMHSSHHGVMLRAPMARQTEVGQVINMLEYQDNIYDMPEQLKDLNTPRSLGRSLESSMTRSQRILSFDTMVQAVAMLGGGRCAATGSRRSLACNRYSMLWRSRTSPSYMSR